MALHQTVQHGIGNGGVAHPCMPMVDRQLTGDDGGLVGGPVVNDFQQVCAGLAVDARHAPVVQQQNVRLGQLQQPLAERAVAVTNAGSVAIVESGQKELRR